MVISQTGKVGIGTTEPGERLEVAGNIEVSGDGNGIKFPGGTVQTTAAAPTWHQLLPAAERFQLVMNDEAVLDKETGLVWERTGSSEEMDWYEAIDYCYGRTTGGRKGWRLPTMEELSSLVDPSEEDPALPEGHPFLGDHVSSYCWSSTTNTLNTSNAWFVYFYVGSDNGNYKSNYYYVRAVRGGQGHDAW